MPPPVTNIDEFSVVGRSYHRLIRDWRVGTAGWMRNFFPFACQLV
jgi:hypothetical protein